MADKKLYYSMGEVAEMFDVNPSLIRHWESKFDCVRPHKNKKGNRMFSPQDVEKLKLIYHLVKERGMTLEGANKVLKRRSGGNELSRDMELLERLQRIRASLVAVREELKGNVDGELVASDVEEEVASVAQSVSAVTHPESGEQEVVSDEPIAQQEKAPQPKSKRKSVHGSVQKNGQKQRARCNCTASENKPGS